ncbi:hypothetical protein [Shinella zoogloeoides]|uniref:hypothetical protein n=1 Tax=Shinella zoogloeoides TaxID=352475 RepID=UPI00299E1645|nr:hypothetical protein [Shinella zoogloeoides]WPE22497.1 hypothetical protein ShzoTeo12_37130 [Shinella zoogloeoides]
MAEQPLSDREIFALLDQAVDLFRGQKAETEGGEAVMEMFIKNTDFIQRAMLIMLAENRPQSGNEP